MYNFINLPTSSINSSFAEIKKEKEDIARKTEFFNLLNMLDNKNVNPQVKHNMPSYREWANSQYSYNKNNLKSSATTNTIIANLIKSYFNLNSLIDGKRSSRIKIRFQRLSLNRILSSKPEIKQTNNKSIITLYVYNRNKKCSFFKLRKLSLRATKARKNLLIIQKNENAQGQSEKFYVSKGKSIYDSALQAPKKVLLLNKYSRRIKVINRKSLLFLNNVRKHKFLFMKALNLNNNFFNFYKNKHYNNYLKKLYKREVLYIYYMKILSVNNFKYKNWFLLGLKNIISNIYKKNVEFNIVNMKYLHYNSNILTEAVSVKLKNRNNRLLKVLKRTIKLLRLPKIRSVIYKNKENINEESSALHQNDNDQNAFFKENNDLLSILKNIKYKTVNGVRIEAAGRLSKRLTASKSVFKYKYKGSLKDIDSSYEKLSSTISRGHVKQNIQYVKLDSKTRNGAFGLKGWISSY